MLIKKNRSSIFLIIQKVQLSFLLSKSQFSFVMHGEKKRKDIFPSSSLLASLTLDSRATNMQITIRDLHGTRRHLNVEPSDTIWQIKQQIQEKKLFDQYGGELNKIFLMFRGAILKNGSTLSDYNIQREQTIHQLYRRCPFEYDYWDLDRMASEVDLSHASITDEQLINIVQRLVEEEMPNLVKLNLSQNKLVNIAPLACSGLQSFSVIKFHQCCAVQQEIAVQFLVQRGGHRSTSSSTTTTTTTTTLTQQQIRSYIFKIPVYLRRRILTFLPLCRYEDSWFHNHQGLFNLEFLDLCENQKLHWWHLKKFLKNTWVRLDDPPPLVQEEDVVVVDRPGLPQNNKYAILRVVAKDGHALNYASEELKNDKEIVMAAVAQDGRALNYASEELKNDKEIVMAAVTQKWSALQYASEELKNDKEIVMVAVTQNWHALQYASEELKNDKEIVMVAVTQNWYALQYASEELKNDKEIVLVAVNQNGYALGYASDELRRDKEIVLTAVNKNGDALQYASRVLKNDKEIVLAAVNQNGIALRYASDELKKDKGIVMAAVNKNGDALQFASDELKKDKEIMSIRGE